MKSALPRLSRVLLQSTGTQPAPALQAALRGFRTSAAASDFDGAGFGGHAATHVGLRIVSQQQVNVVERFGRFNRILEPGLHLLIPIVDRIAYVWSLKETAVPLRNQSAITRDNVLITIDGVLFVKVVDPKRASYGVDNLFYAVAQLAQTTMRSELGKLTLDETLRERDALNSSIAAAINAASADWGVQCLRHEIRDIVPPASLRAAMEMEAEAERRKRARVLESEGARQAEINRAEGHKQRVILESQAAQADAANRAKGDAEAILARAQATAASVDALAAAVTQPGGEAAVRMRIAEQYVAAFGGLAQRGTTMLLPAAAADPAAMVAQAMAIYKAVGGAPPPAAGGQEAAAPRREQPEAATADADAGAGAEPAAAPPKRPWLSLRSDAS